MSENKIDISLIEHFTYCPKQAENVINNLSVHDVFMEDGESFHRRSEARDHFEYGMKKKRSGEKFPQLNNKTLFKHFLELSLKEKDPFIFVEVYVESDSLGICGKCDKVIIKHSSVTIIDYKTTFGKLDGSFDFDKNSSSWNQLFAYALAFREFYEYQQPIHLIIEKVRLNLNELWSGPINKEELVNFNSEDKILCDGWAAERHKPFEKDFDSKINGFAVEEIKKIIQKIKSKDFEHENNEPKCKRCQYKKVCEDSLVI